MAISGMKIPNDEVCYTDISSCEITGGTDMHLRQQNYSILMLTEFSAILQSDSVVLKWAACGTMNNEYFEVQRSTNARTWKVIAQVPTTLQGSLYENYYEADEHPVRGQAYYRLRTVSPDGTSKFSKTIAVYYSGRARSRKSLKLSSKGTVIIKRRTLTSRGMELYNETGHRVIFKSSIVGSDTKLDLGNVTSGVYTLRINRGIVAPSIIKLVKE